MRTLENYITVAEGSLEKQEGLCCQYPQHGSTKRVAFGGFFTVLNQVIDALRYIFLVPLFLSAWGSQVYGEWLTISALVAYLSFANTGIHNYVVNSLTQSYGKGDLVKYTKTLHSALRLYLTISILVGIIFAIFVFFFPFWNWFNISTVGESEIRLSTFILGMNLLLSIPAGLILGIYFSVGDYPRQAFLSSISQIFLIGFLALALFLKGNFVAISVVQLIPMAGLLIFAIWDIRHRYPNINFGFSSADWKLSFSFISPGLIFSLITIADVLKIQGNILIVNIVIGSIAVTIFSIHRTLANLIFKITNSVNCAIWPEITSIESRGDFKKLKQAHNLLVKYSLLFSFSFSIFLFFTGKEIIRIWTHGKVAFEPALWLILLVYLPLNCFWQASSIFQISTNRHKKFSLYRLSSAIFGLILSLIIAKMGGGIVGAFVGFILPEIIICCWFVPMDTLKMINDSPKDFWLNTVGKSLFIVMAQGFTALILVHNISNMIFQWILLAVGIFGIGIFLSYIFWLDDYEKQLGVRFVRLIFK